jgi:1,6-anhydro-N-acetylmuramate kinase
LHECPRGLQDADVVGAAAEGDVRSDVDVSGKGVDAGRSNPLVLARCEASAYAVSMSLTAVVNIVGVGTLSVGAKARPVICEDVENSADAEGLKSPDKFPVTSGVM